MDELGKNIAAYERIQRQLEADHFGEWVVFHGCELFGVYDDSQTAAADAARNFGRGPYLIRKVGQGDLHARLTLVESIR